MPLKRKKGKDGYWSHQRSFEIERKMDIDAIEEMKKMLDDIEKSKENVFERKCEELKLDCNYDNSPLGFEKPMSSWLKKMES